MKHISFDTETWGTTPGSDIRSIGACVFDPFQNLDDQIVTIFYVAVDNPGIAPDEAILTLEDGSTAQDANYPHYDAASDMYRRFNLTRDPKTVKWWSDQSAEAQAAFANPLPLEEGLTAFTDWLSQMAGEHPPLLDLRMWSHGANFDPGILSAVYRACDLSDPIHYRAPRDTRTIFEAAGMDPATCLEGYQSRGAIHHHAAHDAITQARAICDAYRRLGLHDPLTRQLTPGTIIEDLRHQRDDLHAANTRYQQEARDARSGKL